MSTLRNRFTGEIINDKEIELLNLHPNLEETPTLEETAIDIEPEISETTPFLTAAETIAEDELIAGATEIETPWGLGLIALAGTTFIGAEAGQWLYKHFHKTSQPQTKETIQQPQQHLKTLKNDLKNFNAHNNDYQTEINQVKSKLGADFDENNYRAYKLSAIKQILDNINKLQLDQYTPTQRDNINKSIQRIQHQYEIGNAKSLKHFKSEENRQTIINNWSHKALNQRK